MQDENSESFKRGMLKEAQRLDEMNQETERSLKAMRARSDPLAPEMEAMLGLSKRLATQARELGTGVAQRKNDPMKAAMRAACASRSLADWERAMEALAERSMESSSPAHFAGAMLDSLSCARVPPRAYLKLVPPIAYERSLAAPGYEWGWDETECSQSAREAWEAAESFCESAKSAPPF